MQAQPIPNPALSFSLQELEQIETTIQASERLLATLHGRREALGAELDRIMRPQAVVARVARKTIGPGLEYRGVMTVHWSYIDIHTDLLRRLWTEFPERREAMAAAMGAHGATRAYVAKTREELFPGQTPAWALRYSRMLVEGWYVDTNLNRERMRRILPAAVRAARLAWSQDVKWYWKATPAPE
jgi:hypothetical protein